MRNADPLSSRDALRGGTTKGARDMAEQDVRAAVRDARKRLRLTQQEVADLAGLSLRAYNGYERGEFQPQRANMAVILSAVGMDMQVHGDDGEVAWSPDVQVFLDTIGAYLEQLTDAERIRFMREETRRIFSMMRPVDAPSSLLPDEIEAAKQAIRAELPAAAKRAEPERAKRGRRTAG